MTELLILLYGLALALSALLLVERAQRRLEERFPSYARTWARIMGDPVEQPRHVQLVPAARAHYPCKACHSEGWHTEGCSLLDRLDAGEVRP